MDDRYRGSFDVYVKGRSETNAINHKGGYIHSSWTYMPALHNICISLLTRLEYHMIFTFVFFFMSPNSHFEWWNVYVVSLIYEMRFSYEVGGPWNYNLWQLLIQVDLYDNILK